MDSTLLFLAGFFFILGAGIVGLAWIIVTLTRGILKGGTGSSSQDPNLSVLARLMRDLRTQNLVVEMDGKIFNLVGELSPAQQKRLVITANVLEKWLSLPAPAATQLSPDLPTSAASAETAEPAQPADSVESAEQLTPAVIALPAANADTLSPDQLAAFNDWIPVESVPAASIDHHTPPFSSDPAPEVKPVSTQLPDMVGGILNPTPTPAPQYKSIAMQINDILQERIFGTSFEKRGITVSDGSDHGVLVTLDGKKYPGVKDVPDEEVRNLLRSTVLEWEKRSKPSSK